MKTNLLSGKLSNLLGGKRMKKLLVVLVVLGLATYAFGVNKWTYVHGPNKSPYLSSGTIYDISFANDTLGVAVGGLDGGQATFLYTTNSGRTWKRRQTYWGGALRGVICVNPASIADSLRAVVVGDGGFVGYAAIPATISKDTVKNWLVHRVVPDSSVGYYAIAREKTARRSATIVGWKSNGTVRILWSPDVFKSPIAWTTTTTTSLCPVYGVAMRDSFSVGATPAVFGQVLIVGSGGTRALNKVLSKLTSAVTGAISPPMYTAVFGDSLNEYIGGGRGFFMKRTLADSVVTITGVSDDSTVLHVAANKLGTTTYAGGFIVVKDSTKAYPVVSTANDSVITLYTNTSIEALAPGCDSAKKAQDTLKFHLHGVTLTGYAGGVAHFYNALPYDHVVYIIRVSNDSIFTKGIHAGGLAMDSIRIYKAVTDSLPHGASPPGTARLFSNPAFTNVASGFNAQNILKLATNVGDPVYTNLWMVGSGALFAKTTNSGTSWTTIKTGRALGDLYSIVVRDTGKIWVGGRYGVIVRYGAP